MSLHVPVLRQRLPDPAMVVINHPVVGIVIIADPEICDTAISHFLQLIDRRAELHPDRVRQHVQMLEAGDPPEKLPEPIAGLRADEWRHTG